MKKIGNLFAGALAGLGLGLLLAPRKGSETRKILGEKIDELYQKVKEIDYDDVKKDFEKKINDIKKEISELDKEKVLDIAKKKGEEIKSKIDDLATLAKEKATPVVEEKVEDLRKAAVKATKELTKKLEAAKKTK